MEDSEQRSGNGLPSPDQPPGRTRLSEVMEKYQGLVREIFYTGLSGKRARLPYDDYSKASETQQQQIMRALHEAAVADGKRIILEVGPGERLSPLESAVFRPDTVVFAIDPFFVPKETYGSDPARELTERAKQRKTFAAFFGLAAETIDPQLRFDRVQTVFPNAFSHVELAVSASRFVKKGGDLVVVVDPLLHGEPTAEDIVGALPKDFEAALTTIDRTQLKDRYGISDTELAPDARMPVVRAVRKS
ncbi:MAG: hypothetical protein A2900_05125 [Candidatus Chisholmbacteria bacterium RIFCSPLOWO2_01_FULL_50_28]|uniref:Methyltransferase n=1 Tax=Candidatus Chisholmbacteria bacterium RIFCSPHIGHO2_01_FULL_52_32 TaxID=1797591 RepID=A0A1G1VS20_9BACT|nr:MAG: hypothetical protein A2786_01615 [Candidatus Chisholmbacteria bacterium RIFCSPHIGHO2_01_FULL_52_32]OGY20430.1 MAG: hypothetical protein A2900_05125 [Candidatus Chisholmbacteria bacterium RIFCSPLOWO2_01_FULL_50_28]